MSGKRWRRAIDVPKSWEGMEAWQWNDWEPDNLYGPRRAIIPRDFDRSPRGCANVYFMLMPKNPDPPDLKFRTAKEQNLA